MTTSPDRPASRPVRAHPTQVRLALLADAEHPARPTLVNGCDGSVVDVAHAGGGTDRLVVGDPDRLRAVLARADLCRVQGWPFALVNVHHGVLALATGPPAPPARLELVVVSRLEDGGVVEVPSADPDQPSWQILALVEEDDDGRLSCR